MGRFCLFILFAFIISLQVNGQSANLDQIRNGPANDPSKNFWDNFDNPQHVNGNAGASNAHYVESHSISYRALLTLLTPGQTYSYIIEYDTKHSSAMAIDYLTHFQRLEPHGQFNHTPSGAEVINPRIFEEGSNEYIFTGTSSTFAIPAPNQPNSGTPVSGLPQNSFNALPSADRLMTIYRGTIDSIRYLEQQSLTTSASESKTSMKISFTADDDSVVLAWGGHIASRLDWGFINGKPRSAGGISGSPYHMRHLFMRNETTATNISLGNQDRSLSAAAVFPPPVCPTVPSQTVCAGSPFGTFSISSPDAGTVYTWSFGTNTAGAAFSGSNVGTSVTIVKSGGGSFTGGSFTLNISAVKNGQTVVCTGVASGTVETVVVNAAANPTSIDITSAAHNTTLTATIGASSTDPNQDNYDYVWTIETAGIAAGSLTNATSRVATFTANIADAGKTVQFKVVATEKNDNNANTPECSDDATVSVDINSIGACDITPSNAVCAGTEVTHNGTPDPKSSNATYTWSLSGFNGSGTTTSTFVGTTLNQVQVKVNATQSYRITLTQTYANTALNTSCTEDVSVTATPSVSATYVPPACDETTFKVTVNSPTTGFEYDISQPGNSINYSPITATAGNPVQFTNLVQGDGWTVTVKTGGPGCTASTSCETNPAAISSNSVLDPTTANKNASDLNKLSDNVAETYTITLPSGTKVKSLPNPYTDRVRFNLVSGISGLAILELHNVLGQKVAVVYQGYIKAGSELSKEYFVPVKDRGTLIYTFRVGDQKISGKLVPVR